MALTCNMAQWLALLLIGISAVVSAQSLASLQLWTATAPDDPVSTNPVVYSQPLGVVVVLTSSGSLMGVNATSGLQVWLSTAPVCPTPSFLQLINSTTVLVGCAASLVLVSVQSGATVATGALPGGLETTATAAGQYVSVASAPYLVVSVYNETNQTYASMLFNTATAGFVINSFTPCLATYQINRLVSAPGDPGYFQACAAESVSYRSLPGRAQASWDYVNASFQAVSATSYASAQYLSNLAVSFYFKRHIFVTAFLMGSSTATPQWYTMLPRKYYYQATLPQFVGIGEMIIAEDRAGHAFGVSSLGNLSWKSVDLGYQVSIFPNPYSQGDFFATGGSEFMSVDALTGVVIASTPTIGYESPQVMVPVTFYTTLVAPNQTSTFPSALQNVVASVTSENLELYDPVQHQFIAQISTGQATNIVGQPFVVQQPGSTLPLGVVTTSSGGVLQMFSLSMGWSISNVDSYTRQDSVIFTDNGSVAALDLNGQPLWSLVDRASGGTSELTPFTFNTLLQVTNDGTAVVVYDTFTGSLVRTITLPTDCHTAGSDPQPIIATIVVNANKTAAYFTASLACLFQLSADLTLTWAPLFDAVGCTPVVDNDNNRVYLYTMHTLSQVTFTTTPPSQKQLAVFESRINAVVPSSQFANPNGYDQGHNAMVYVFTNDGVTAVDVTTPFGLKAWMQPLRTLQSYAFFNNSLYTVANSGICRISLDPVAPQRVLWCQGAVFVLQAYTFSNFVFSSDGSLFLVMDNKLFAMSAFDASPTWFFDGYQTIWGQPSCPQLAFLQEPQLLMVVCTGQAYAMDCQDPTHPVLFSVVQETIGNVDFVPASSSLIVATEDVLTCFALPSTVLHRAVPPGLTPAPTMPWKPETLPPDATASPVTPSPYLPQYPPPPITSGPNTVLLRVDSFGNGLAVTSLAAPSDSALSGMLFLSPRLNYDQDCVAEAYNTTTGALLLWNSSVNSTLVPSCNCGTPRISAGGNQLASSVVALQCNGILFVLDALTGTLLWQDVSSAISEVHVLSSAGSTTAPLVVSINATLVRVRAARTGAVAASAVNAANTSAYAAMQSQVFHVAASPPPSASVFLLSLVGANGGQLWNISTSTAGAVQLTPALTLLYSGICGSQLLFAAPAVWGAAPYVSPSSIYGACLSSTNTSVAVVFAYTITAAHFSILQTISLVVDQAPTNYVNLLTVDYGTSTSYLYLATTVSVFVVDLMQPTLLATRLFSPVNPPFLLAVTSAQLLVWSSVNGPASTTVIAYSKVAGWTPAWNNTQTYVNLPSIPMIAPSLPAMYIAASDLVVVCTESVVALNASSGSTVWISTTNDNSFPRSMTLQASSFHYPNGQAVPSLAITYLSAQQTVAKAIALPAQLADASFCFESESYAFTPGGVVATDSSYGDSVFLLTNFLSWTEAVPTSGFLFSFAAESSIVVMIQDFAVVLYETATGNSVASLSRAAVCPASEGDALSSPPASVSVGLMLYFADDNCLFALNGATYQMTATFLSSSLGLGVVSISTDNQTVFLASSVGIYAAVDVSSMKTLWTNDVVSLLGAVAAGAGQVVELAYAASTPLAQRQLIVMGDSVVVSLSLFTGNTLWYSFVEGANEFNPVQTFLASDGNLLVATGTVLVKLSVDANVDVDLDRTMWNVSHSVAFDPYSTWGVAIRIPGTRIVVCATYMQIEAFDDGTGEMLWSITPSFEVDQYDYFSTATLVADPTGVWNTPVVVLVANHNAFFSMALNPTNGDVLWMLEGSQEAQGPYGRIAVLPSNAPTTTCIINVTFPSWTSVLPPVPEAFSPVVAPDYSFVLPLPSTSAAPAPSMGNPSAFWTWEVNQGEEFYNSQSANGFQTQMGDRSVFLMLNFNGSTYNNLVAELQVIDVVSGAVLSVSQPWDESCTPFFLGPISHGMTAYVICVAETNYYTYLYTSVVLDVSSPDLQMVAALPQVMSNNNFNSDEVTIIPVSGADALTTGCFYPSSATIIYCVQYDPQDPDTAGIFNLTCPAGGGDYLVGSPVHSAASQLLVFACQGHNSSVSAVHLSNQSVKWQVDYVVFPDSTPKIKAFYASATLPFASVLLSNPYAEKAPFGWNVLDVATGVNVSSTTTDSCGTPSNFNVVSVVNETTQRQVYVAVMFCDYSLKGATSAGGARLWGQDIDEDASAGFSLVIVNETTNRPVYVYTISQDSTAIVLGFDVVTGVQQFQVIFTPNVGVYQILSASLVFNDSMILVSCNSYNAFGLVNLQTLSVVVFSTRKDELQTAFLPLAAPTSTAAGIFDGITGMGEMVQYIVGGWSGTPRKFTAYQVVTDPVDNSEYVAATLNTYFYLLSSNGSVIWGTNVPSDTSQGEFPFGPALFSLANGEKILLKPLSSRAMYAFNALNGTLLYVAYFPLCDGTAPNGDSSFAWAVDHVNQHYFVSGGTPCLYRIDVNSSAVTAVSVGVPLAAALVRGVSCVLAVDSFSTLHCILPTSMVRAWSFRTGYTSSSRAPVVAVESGLVLFATANTLYCLVEETGLLAWEVSVGFGATFTTFGGVVYVVSFTAITAVDLNPAIPAPQRVMWTVATAEVFSNVIVTTESLPRPFVAVNGVLVAAIYNEIVGINVAQPTVVQFHVIKSSGVCSSLQYYPAPSGANSSVADVFLSTCVDTAVHSVVTGESIIFLTRTGGDESCGSSPAQILVGTGAVVFCNSDSFVDVQPIPQYVVSHAPAVVPIPTLPPTTYSLPPGYVPQGVPSPAPTFPNSANYPDLSCLQWIQVEQPTLQSCVTQAMTFAYVSGNPNAVNCTGTSANVSRCILPWVATSTCVGAAVYVNTMIAGLQSTGALDFCNNPERCSDGVDGAVTLCAMLHFVRGQADGEVMPSTLISALPFPSRNLPSYIPPSQPPSAPMPSGGLAAGAVVGVVLGVVVFCVTAVLTYRVASSRKRSAASAALLGATSIQEDPPAAGEKGSSDELHTTSLFSGAISSKRTVGDHSTPYSTL